MAPSRAAFTVRELDTTNPSDIKAYKESTVRLQDIEAALDDRFLPGEEVIDPWVNHVLDENRRSGGKIFVVEDAATGPIGFVWAKVLPSPPEQNIFLKPSTSVYLYDMQIEEPYREQGAGKALLDRVVDFARERKIHTIIVENVAGNTRDIEFFAAENFEPSMVTMTREVSTQAPS